MRTGESVKKLHREFKQKCQLKQVRAGYTWIDWFPELMRSMSKLK